MVFPPRVKLWALRILRFLPVGAFLAWHVHQGIAFFEIRNLELSGTYVEGEAVSVSVPGNWSVPAPFASVRYTFGYDDDVEPPTEAVTTVLNTQALDLAPGDPVLVAYEPGDRDESILFERTREAKSQLFKLIAILDLVLITLVLQIWQTVKKRRAETADTADTSL